MNPLFTLREEFRFHDSGRFRKKAGDAKFRFYHSFCPSFDVFSCGVLPESGGVGTPAETLFTMGKGLKEFQLCDSRRLRKKPQDAQDDVTEHSSICLMPILGLERYTEFGLPKAVLPVQHVDVCVILPAFCGFMVSGKLLKQLGAFRASCRNPKNRIATRSNAWIWRARFWSRLLLK